MDSLRDIILLVLGAARMFIFIYFIMSWLISFDVLNVRQPLVGQIWYTLQRMLEPLFRPIRRYMPDLGGVDLSPLVLLLIIYALEIITFNNLR